MRPGHENRDMCEEQGEKGSKMWGLMEGWMKAPADSVCVTAFVRILGPGQAQQLKALSVWPPGLRPGHRQLRVVQLPALQLRPRRCAACLGPPLEQHLPGGESVTRAWTGHPLPWQPLQDPLLFLPLPFPNAALSF